MDWHIVFLYFLDSLMTWNNINLYSTTAQIPSFPSSQEPVAPWTYNAPPKPCHYPENIDNGKEKKHTRKTHKESKSDVASAGHDARMRPYSMRSHLDQSHKSIIHRVIQRLFTRFTTPPLAPHITLEARFTTHFGTQQISPNDDPSFELFIEFG